MASSPRDLGLTIRSQLPKVRQTFWIADATKHADHQRNAFTDPGTGYIHLIGAELGVQQGLRLSAGSDEEHACNGPHGLIVGVQRLDDSSSSHAR